MYFKSVFSIRNLLLKLDDGKTLRFDYGGPHENLVEIRLPNAGEQEIGFKTDNPICTSFSQQNANEKITKMFEALDKNKMPTGSEIPKEGEQHSEYIDEKGNVQESGRFGEGR